MILTITINFYHFHEDFIIFMKFSTFCHRLLQYFFLSYQEIFSALDDIFNYIYIYFTSGVHPDIPCLLEMILDSCDSGIGGCDHTGMTLFDIKERVSDSSLKCLKPMVSRAMISVKKGR